MASFHSIPAEVRLLIAEHLQHDPQARLLALRMTCKQFCAEFEPTQACNISLLWPERNTLLMLAYRIFTEPLLASAVRSFKCGIVDAILPPSQDQTTREWSQMTSNVDRSGWPAGPATSDVLEAVVRGATENDQEFEEIYPVIRNGSRLDFIVALMVFHLPSLDFLGLGRIRFVGHHLSRRLFRGAAQRLTNGTITTTLYKFTSMECMFGEGGFDSYPHMAEFYDLPGLQSLKIQEAAPPIVDSDEFSVKTPDRLSRGRTPVMDLRLLRLEPQHLCLVEKEYLDDVVRYCPQLKQSIVMTSDEIALRELQGWSEVTSSRAFQTNLETMSDKLQTLVLNSYPFGAEVCLDGTTIREFSLRNLSSLQTLVMSVDWLWDLHDARNYVSGLANTEGASLEIPQRLATVVPENLKCLHLTSVDMTENMHSVVAHAVADMIRLHHIPYSEPYHTEQRFPNLRFISIQYVNITGHALEQVFNDGIQCATDAGLHFGRNRAVESLSDFRLRFGLCESNPSGLKGEHRDSKSLPSTAMIPAAIIAPQWY